MKKVLVLCNAGMSSSLIAKKAFDYFKKENKEIEVTATTVMQGETTIKDGEYDLYLLSPQMRMNFKKFEKIANENDKKIVQIPFNAYAPTESGVKNIVKLIKDNL
ncbi:PTS cellobiose transporter subunit IIB [Anaerococcus sp. AGMB00486]|uniref:PTS cellobiose transporter subunit IIB n=1 Tax=Anaerococcus faecalis TaxID=2742993 RepID=A0ABX2NCQ9_9FIRM|nr:PTS cellobiose transporter subunit IIB [Anaerococcus faecalis]NVF12519.1 PTS cellobiose transporter subunit IIB [Anaerococcus faecalis]